MSFFTEIQLPEFPWKIDHSKKVMLLGSCFSENIGQKLLDLKYSVDMNPFGILYNPESIANSLKILLEKRVFTETDLFQDQGMWNSFFHHSRFSDANRDVALENINKRISSSAEFLKKADFLLITFGTSWVFEYKETGLIVSNCHKIPAAKFKRFRLGVFEITDRYRDLLEEIWKVNPNLKVVFTISPIRHWKDGAVENQVSKSTLILAVDRLKTGFGEKVCGYFPSYEIMMDELRDYRFYAEDMLHISPVATDYIFERFSKSMITNESNETSKLLLKIRKAFLHRPVNPDSAEFEKFVQANLNEIQNLETKFPGLNFGEEQNYFQHELERFRAK